MARLRLNQIIAVVSGKKTRAENFLTAAHHGLKPNMITGLSRTYTPIDDGGEKLQREGNTVQMRVVDALKSVSTELTTYYNAVATQEYGNLTAAADIVVSGKTILSKVPVTILLFLEKRFVDIRTFIGKLPTLPKDKLWNWDENKNCFISESEQTRRTQKVAVPVVLSEATKEHPAQVKMEYEDRLVGHWTKTDFSGAIPAQQQADMLERCEAMIEAIKIAREEANSQEIDQKEIGKKVLNFVFNLRAPLATA